MNDLLAAVTKAHGDPASFGHVSGGVTARMTIGGPFLGFRGAARAIGQQMVGIDTRRQHIKFRRREMYPAVSSNTDNDARKVIRDGDAVEERIDPRACLRRLHNCVEVGRYADPHLISHAVRHYLMEPFLFSLPGVQADEIDPWEENGELWRRLSVTYPGSIATHSSNHIYYIDQEGIQRRMDYAPDVNGAVPINHYTHQHARLMGSLCLRSGQFIAGIPTGLPTWPPPGSHSTSRKRCSRWSASPAPRGLVGTRLEVGSSSPSLF